ncbi:GNAT family N-acetyltransferase [Aquipuribacter sp. MA13-6]|uniref:GNAT family N-acetyltransferase n=1 Tax=unclassified Aquipuribacter TaxID=2635084 RepID=UPI003EE9E044
MIRRLEQTEAATVLALVDALVARGCVDPVPTAVPLGRGLLVISGARRYVNRAVGVTLDELSPDDVTTLVRHYADAGLPAAVQLSSWAPASTVAALGAAGFVPAWCRTMFAVDPRAAPSTGRTVPPVDRRIEIVEVGADDTLSTWAADVMIAEALAAGADRTTSDEFMDADRGATGTTQLLALLDGQPVGCGSLSVVGSTGRRTGWLGAAATIPSARGRGVQTALVRHRLQLAVGAGCDLVGATASVGSTSGRVLTRCGLALVQEQWVLQRADDALGRLARQVEPDGSVAQR